MDPSPALLARNREGAREAVLQTGGVLPVFLSPDGAIKSCPPALSALLQRDADGPLVGKSLLALLEQAGWAVPRSLREGDEHAPEACRLESTHPGLPPLELALHPCPEGCLATLSPREDPATAESPNGPTDGIEALLEVCPSVYYRQEDDLRFTWLGPGADKLFGLPAEALRTSPEVFRSLLVADDLPGFRRSLKRAATQAQGGFDFRIRQPESGSVRYLRDFRQRHPDGGWQGVFWDITRQTIAEKHLRRTAWKEHLATLTSGLVHDFSNVMAGISGLADLYHQDLDEDHPWYKGIGQIRKNALEARKLVRRIVDLNREQERAPTYLNIETLVQEQLELAPAILPKGTHVETDFPGEEIPVYLDPVGFRQVFLNFLINCRDALASKGEVRVSIRKTPAGSAILEGCHGCEGMVAEREGVELRIADNGCGIPAEHLARIFDPYFTTKDTTQGSGFGLYNARLFAEENHGRLGVRSTPGEGCAITLFLPVATFSEDTDEPDGDESQGAFSEAEDGRRRRILAFSAPRSVGCNLIELMIAREWEVLTLSRPQALRDQLADKSQPAPDLVAIIDPEQDVHAHALVQMVRARFPELPLVLRVFGRNPDELASSLRKEVTAVFDESHRDADVVKRMSTLFAD